MAFGGRLGVQAFGFSVLRVHVGFIGFAVGGIHPHTGAFLLGAKNGFSHGLALSSRAKGALHKYCTRFCRGLCTEALNPT